MSGFNPKYLVDSQEELINSELSDIDRAIDAAERISGSNDVRYFNKTLAELKNKIIATQGRIEKAAENTTESLNKMQEMANIAKTLSTASVSSFGDIASMFSALKKLLNIASMASFGGGVIQSTIAPQVEINKKKAQTQLAQRLKKIENLTKKNK